MSTQKEFHPTPQAAISELFADVGPQALLEAVLQLQAPPNWRGYDADLDILYSWYSDQREHAASYEVDGFTLVLDIEARTLIGYEVNDYSKLLVSLAPAWKRPYIWLKARRSLAHDIAMMPSDEFRKRIGLQSPDFAPGDQVRSVQQMALSLA